MKRKDYIPLQFSHSKVLFGDISFQWSGEQNL